MKRFVIAVALVIAASYVVVGCEPQLAEGSGSAAQTTPAYGVLVLRKAALEAELADLLDRVTRTHPSVESKRFELRAIQLEMRKVLAFQPARAAKLSSTVGNLILHKVALEVELKNLLGNFTSQHPDVKKKTVELAALEREIENILR